jgi:hypothetical protein
VSEANGSKGLQRLRIAAAAVVSVGLLAPLAVFGGVGWAQGNPSAAQYQYKVTICHHTHSKKNPTVTITISVRAWPAHQRHGDTFGPCASSKPKHANNGQAHANNSHANANSQTHGNAPAKGHSK